MPHEFDGIGQLWMKDADIEGQSMGRQQADAFDEIGLQAKVRGLRLQQSPDALDQWNTGQFREIVVDFFPLFERRVGHDPANPVVPPGQS